jgi:phosphoribosyl 1,2-cyclic phosphodiesterase
MKVKFYGTRGSTPVPELDRMAYGGNTACVLVRFDSGRIAVLDAGTGLRKLGNDLLHEGLEQLDNIVIALSHTHWDHIQGFPFFKPAYDDRRHFTIAIGGRPTDRMDLHRVFAGQMQREYFPVPFAAMGAHFDFWQPELEEYFHPSGVHIMVSRHCHPGGAYGYRISDGGKTLVYCSDVEHADGIDANVVRLARDADLLIHDAQYTPEELKEKKGWGHSSWVEAVEVAEAAGVKRLALFHHDPDHDDNFIAAMKSQCRNRFPAAFFAREGEEITL